MFHCDTFLLKQKDLQTTYGIEVKVFRACIDQLPYMEIKQ